MASSKEAFSRFEMWKNSRTVLRLTVYDRGAVDHFTGSIYHVDFDGEFIGFVVTATRSYLPTLDLRESFFTVEPFKVEVTDPRFGKVIFEEVRTV
jgi:hypothetical protein